MALANELEAQQWTLLLEKHCRQRPEHIIAEINKHRFTHIHPYIFIHLYQWNLIPDKFLWVVREINRSGRIYDGSVYGTYSLTLRPKKDAAVQKRSKGQFVAGCKIIYSIQDGFVCKEIKCNSPAFQKLMLNARLWDERSEADRVEALRQERENAMKIRLGGVCRLSDFKHRTLE